MDRAMNGITDRTSDKMLFSAMDRITDRQNSFIMNNDYDSIEKLHITQCFNKNNNNSGSYEASSCFHLEVRMKSDEK